MRITKDAVRTFEIATQRDLGLERFNLNLLHDRSMHLSMLVVPRGMRSTGLGSEAMRRLSRFADDFGLKVTLSPSSRDKYLGTTSHARLVKFYKQFGYVENKGRARDLTIDANVMTRLPRSQPGNRQGGHWSVGAKFGRM